jgi:glucosylceramidase
VAIVAANGPLVSVWLTTDDQTKRLQSQGAVSFSTADGGNNVIFVDETQKYQAVEGFGAAFTDSAAYLLNEVAAPAVRQDLMNDLFTRKGNGIGLSFMRDPIGASDLSRSWYTFDDMPPGDSDPSLEHFSIYHDQEDIIPVILEAKQLNPDLKVMANPWSPPGWMKTSDSMVGGSLLGSMYGPFTKYLIRYIQAYADAGIPIDYLGLQNEPESNPPNAPGMLMDAPTQQLILRQYLLPGLAANNIATKVLIWDSNWDTPSYPQAVLSDPTLMESSQIAGVAWHGYGGTPGMQSTLQRQGVNNYETEHSGGTWIADQVKADFEEIIEVMRNWGRSYVKWSLALNEDNGPATGGCENRCTPLVTVNSQSGTVSYRIEYYTLGHFSKFVFPGAIRIFSSNGIGVVSAAFINPDDSKVLVAFNDSGNIQTFEVQWGDKQFSYSLPAFCGVTFTWAGQQSGGYTVDARSQIQASSYSDALWLATDLSQDVNGGYILGYSMAGDYALYKNVDFGQGVTQVQARVASAGNGGTLQFHVDSVDGPLIASVTIPVTGGWQSWMTSSAAVAGVTGVHDVYIVFQGTTGIGNINWFRFS